MKSTLNLQLQGFPAANRDAEVTLVNNATGQTLKRNPFLDGSLAVRDLDPGLWDVKVTHPNVISPIYTGRVRLFPQNIPTFVPIPIPPAIFRDTPIRDIPDANLGPVQQAVTAARDSLAPIANKVPGEVIRAADWNMLAAAVRDLAGSVLELTKLLSPQGHDHPEIAEKIAEVQDNIRSFSEAFGRSLLELRRDLEREHLRRVLTGVLDAAQAPATTREDLLRRVDDLGEVLQADPTVFTGQLNRFGSRTLTSLAELTTANPELQNNPEVKKLQNIAQQYTISGTATNADAELKLYTRTGTAAGSKLSTVVMTRNL
jgi:hypothetical protein